MTQDYTVGVGGEDMNEEMMDLGRRAVACKGWRWMPGMLAQPSFLRQEEAWLLCWAEQVWDAAEQELTDAWLAGGYNANNGKVWAIGSSGSDPIDLAGWFPDLSDPATLGCLLALVREAWNEPSASPFKELHRSGGTVEMWWCVYVGEHCFELPTEAAALVAALEAAP